MKNKRSNINQAALGKQLTLAFLSWILYAIAGVIVFYAGVAIYHSNSYMGWEIMYQIAQLVQSSLLFIAVVYLLIGYVLIHYHFMRKPYEQMAELVNAARKVYETDELLPELSPELQDFSIQLAEIKLRLQQNARAAREAEQRKNDLVVYLAHDLKTPLTSVIGYLSLLHDEKEISPELARKYLDITLNKSLRLEDLINEFFDITRFNLTTLTLEPSRINLSMMLEQLRYEFAPMLADKSLSLELTCPAGLMYTCDPDKMQRVFDNLIRNAVNYSYENTAITFHVWTTGEVLLIDITNHGRTIIPEKLARIFEQFYRIDSSRSTQSGGSGLGLAIAREIIELHSGSITAESQDEMIAFHIRLPLF